MVESSSLTSGHLGKRSRDEQQAEHHHWTDDPCEGERRPVHPQPKKSASWTASSCRRPGQQQRDLCFAAVPVSGSDTATAADAADAADVAAGAAADAADAYVDEGAEAEAGTEAETAAAEAAEAAATGAAARDASAATAATARRSTSIHTTTESCTASDATKKTMQEGLTRGDSRDEGHQQEHVRDARYCKSIDIGGANHEPAAASSGMVSAAPTPRCGSHPTCYTCVSGMHPS